MTHVKISIQPSQRIVVPFIATIPLLAFATILGCAETDNNVATNADMNIESTEAQQATPPALQPLVESQDPETKEENIPTSRGRAWAQALQGGDKLAGYTDIQLNELKDSVDGWLCEHGYIDSGTKTSYEILECPLDPVDVEDEDPAVSTRVWFHVLNSRIYLQCNWFDTTERWQCYRLTQTIEGLNDTPQVITGPMGEVELGDMISIEALLGQDVATAFYQAFKEVYGTGGAPGVAYVFPNELTHTESGMHFTIHYARASGTQPEPTVQTEATWNAADETWALVETPKAD